MDVLPSRPDEFEAWRTAPHDVPSPDPRFEIRRAVPEDFPRIYETVDAAFGTRRPPSLFDWMYLRNPSGLARFWIMTERSSGQVVRSVGGFPWPIRRGTQVLRGTMGADSATHPDWQRQGLARMMRPPTQIEWDRSVVSIGGPNRSSRAFVKNTAGSEEALLGRLRAGVLPLDEKRLLARAGLSPRMTAVFSPALRTLSSVASVFGNRNGSSVDTQEVHRFDTRFDPVTIRYMQTPFYWCPHNATFLNWRYLDHPTEPYFAFAVIERDEPLAYAVARIDEEEASIVEFVADPSARAVQRALLRSVLERARATGSGWLRFEASPRFPHWGFFTLAGFLPVPSPNYVDLYAMEAPPEARDFRNWQLVPGDRDYR